MIGYFKGYYFRYPLPFTYEQNKIKCLSAMALREFFASVRKSNLLLTFHLVCILKKLFASLSVNSGGISKHFYHYSPPLPVIIATMYNESCPILSQG